MRKKLYQFLLIGVLIVSSAITAIPAKAQSTLVYSEDFSGTSLPSPWYACPIWYNCTTGGRVDQGALAEAWMLGSQVIVPGDGYLHLRADFLNPPKSQDGLTYPYKSGYTQTGGYAYSSSIPKKWFTYGYFEARLKCPDMDGAWCAFWLWADPQSSAEIDITETLGNDPYIHNMNLHGAATFSRTYRMSTPNTEWHVYAVDWQAGYIKWYVDGVLTGTYTGTAFNNKSLYMLLTYQLGGTWAGPVDESKLPNDMLVDWVKAWDTRPTDSGVTYTISGNAGVAGATLTYTDGTQKSVTADANGNYSLQVSSNWSGTVTPSKTSHAFAPSSRTYTNVTANKSGENYSATAFTFADVPPTYSETLGGVTYLLYPYIEALYDAGYTAGCDLDPLRYCPSQKLLRGQYAVFMMRAVNSVSYTPPAPTDPLFQDDWSMGTWVQPWAEAMYEAGLTAGCSTDPLMFCPWSGVTREQAAIFGLRVKYGDEYTPPPASGSVFADMTDASHWSTAWVEKAYQDGLIPACGKQGGKPLFCPNDLQNRAWAAYMIVKALDLPVDINP